MKRICFELILAAVLGALFLAFWVWQAPGASAKLTSADIDRYVGRIEKRVPLPPEEASEFLARLRAWGAADDGKPVYMVNLMRYYDQVKRIPGLPPVQGTPVEANARYESAVTPLLVKGGVVPLLGGDTQGMRTAGTRHSNLFGYESEVDDWSRILLVRYPNRRAFFELISDPTYLEFMPNKLASLKLGLVPVDGDAVLPDLRWPVGGFLLLTFLVVGWVRAARSR